MILELFASIQQRKLNQVMKTIEQWQLLFKIEQNMNWVALLGWKAEFLIYLKDYDGVTKVFDQIEGIIKKSSMNPPMTTCIYRYAKALNDIILLEEYLRSNNKSRVLEFKKNAARSTKLLLRNAKKSPRIRTSGFRLIGQYFWITGDRKKAVNLWKKSIKEGKRLRARPDLARTYMEIGKRFKEEKSRYKELDGISAEGYLEKARGMFQEMDLQWDLDELDKIAVAG